MKDLTEESHQAQEQVNAYFQFRSSFWKDIYTSNGVFAETIRDRQAAVVAWIDSLGLTPGSRVLEIGCGAGFLTVILAQRGFHVHAIDSVEEMIEQTRRHVAESGLANLVSVDTGDVFALTFEDGAFDLVTALGVIPWLNQPELALQEMARVTRPGGHVIITAANRAGLYVLLDPLKNPALVPIRRRVKDALERIGHRRSPYLLPSITFHDRRFIDEALARAGLVKTRGMTRGFEFSFLRRQVPPEPLATLLHNGLQHLADRNIPGFRSSGMAYFVLSRKSASRPLVPSTSVEESVFADTKGL